MTDKNNALTDLALRSSQPPAPDRAEKQSVDRSNEAEQPKRAKRQMDCGEVFWSWASPQQR